MRNHKHFSLRFLAILVLALLCLPTGLINAEILSIRLNQVGYPPAFPKCATIVGGSTTPLPWQLKNGMGKVVASGQTVVYGSDAASGDHVHIADFTSYRKQGTGYTLHVGPASSHPFMIDPAVISRLKYDALAFFYHSRSGIPISLPYAGGSEWTRPAGHAGIHPNTGDTDVPCAPGTDCSYRLVVRCGWYDAGDQGKYVVNGGIADKQGYGVPFLHTSGYPWGSNSFVLNNGIILALAYEFTKNPVYLNGAAESLDYVLGRNAMDKSYVSGYGSNPLQNPHHRFWARQKDAGFPPPYPGPISGGPNSALQDPVASSQLKSYTPQKCYIDDIESYSTNEVAINWNAPLAWLSAFLDEKAKR